MGQIQKSITLKVPVNYAFGFVSDLDNLLKFIVGVNEIDAPAQINMGDGSRVTYTIERPIGGEFDCEMELEDYVYNIGWTSNSVSGPHITENWYFKSINNKANNSQATYSLDYDVPVPIIGYLIDILFLKKYWSMCVDKSLNNLKLILEKQYFLDTNKYINSPLVNLH